MQKGNTVKWTSTDEIGEYSHVGELIDINETTATIRVGGQQPGEMTFMRDEGKLSIVTKSDKPAANDPAPVATAPGTPATGTKKARVIELIRNAGDITRQQGITLIVDQIGMTPAGASTYYAMAKKELA